MCKLWRGFAGFVRPPSQAACIVQGRVQGWQVRSRWTASTCIADRHQRRLKLPHLLREQLHIAARRQRHQLKPVAMFRYDVKRLCPYRACRPNTTQGEGFATSGQMYRSCMRLLVETSHLWSPVWTASASTKLALAASVHVQAASPRPGKHTPFSLSAQGSPAPAPSQAKLKAGRCHCCYTLCFSWASA